MRKSVVLITGAEGEIGHGLVTSLAASGASIVTLDLVPLDAYDTLAAVHAVEPTSSLPTSSLPVIA